MWLQFSVLSVSSVSNWLVAFYPNTSIVDVWFAIAI